MWPQLRLSFAVASAIEAGHGQFENYRRTDAERRYPDLWGEELSSETHGGLLAHARASDAHQYAKFGRYALPEPIAREPWGRGLLAER